MLYREGNYVLDWKEEDNKVYYKAYIDVPVKKKEKKCTTDLKKNSTQTKGKQCLGGKSSTEIGTIK